MSVNTKKWWVEGHHEPIYNLHKYVLFFSLKVYKGNININGLILYIINWKLSQWIKDLSSTAVTLACSAACKLSTLADRLST